jgi:hypothetical protein
MLYSRMFLGNSSGSPVFAPEVSSDFAWRLVSVRYSPLFPAPTPIQQPIRRSYHAAALENFDRIESQARQKCRRETRNSSYKGARPSLLECALAKKGGGGALLRIQPCHREAAGIAVPNRSRGGLNLAPAVGHDNHANVFGLPNDSENQVGKKQPAHEVLFLGPAH